MEAARLLVGPAGKHLSREQRGHLHPALNEYFASLDEVDDRPGSYLARGVTLENLGKAAEAGFTYTWSPGTYLRSVSASQVIFDAGADMPSPNPFTYTLTATKSG